MPEINGLAMVDDSSPYHHQGAYKNHFPLPSPSNYSDAEMSPDIENSYIQQNLPVRRQSLVVYHDKIRNEKQHQNDPKRHSSLNIPTYVANDGGDCRKNRLHVSKSLGALQNAAEEQPRYRRSRMPNPPLTIQITQPNSNTTMQQQSPSTVNSSNSSSSNPSPFELCMDTLFEEEQKQHQSMTHSQQQQPQQQHYHQRQSIPRFIGLLRPSKSETCNDNKRIEDTIQQMSPTVNPLSQSWNDNMAQPLSRLKNVFARLQTNTASVNPNTHPIVPTATKSKRMSGQINETKKKKRVSTSVLVKKEELSASVPAVAVYGSGSKSKKKRRVPVVYTALLSHVSQEFLKRMQISAVVHKDDTQYHDVFYGSEAVNCMLDILSTDDRNLALLVGRALESQGLFHHVNYDRRLRDTDTELYQFEYLEHNDDTPSYGGRPPIPSQFISSPTTTAGTKLLSLKKSNRRNAPSVCETVPVNGIFSVLTDCYSPTCTRKSPCYSITCPRMIKQKSTQRPLSSQFLRTDKEIQLRSLWRHSVPMNVVMGTNNMEQKRQECIYELIYTEEDFARDMHYVQDFWIEPLKSSDIIPADRRSQFITDVFWNLADIERISRNLTRDLTARQDKHSVIPSIGDILIEHVKGFEPFVIYGAHQMIGKHKFELEKKRNHKFLQFAEKLERQPESRRLELNGYLTKPTSRLGRYNLLLDTIHHLTPPDHQDFDDIPKVIDMITDFLVQLDRQVGVSDNAFHLEQIASHILPTKGNFKLDLMDPERLLLMQGKMKRPSQNNSKSLNSAVSPIIDSSACIDIQLFLFDHYLVMCKIKQQDGTDHYKVHRKPLSLKTLVASIPNTVIIPSTTKSTIYNKISHSTFHNTASLQDTLNSTQQKLNGCFPIIFQAGNEPPITLIASTESTRKLWLDKIKAQQQRML